MNNKTKLALLALALFLTTAATVFLSTGGAAYVYAPDVGITDAVVQVTLIGLIWLVVAWFSLRSLGARLSYLVVAAVALVGAVAAAYGTASCFLSFCPLVYELLAFTALGLPLLALLLAPAFSRPVGLPFGFLLLTLAYAAPLLFANPLAAALPYATVFLATWVLSRIAPPDKGNHQPPPAGLRRWLLRGGTLLTLLMVCVWPTGFAQTLSNPFTTVCVTLALLGPSLLAVAAGLAILEPRT